MYSSHNGHVEVVDKLLQHGATVDLQAKVSTKDYVMAMYLGLGDNMGPVYMYNVVHQ